MVVRVSDPFEHRVWAPDGVIAEDGAAPTVTVVGADVPVQPVDTLLITT